MLHDSRITAETGEIAALAVDGPQPVWMTLNGARERAFTGEIIFETEPEVLAYLDNGIVYYAERASDMSLGRRLLDAGVVDVAQLERGTVRVGDIEHLGRLFDRDPSVDRDEVAVLAETATQELIAELANQSIATVRFTAYRHHPSGVHRWFVAPWDSAAVARPVNAVAQLDRAVVDDLPGSSFDGDDDFVIEWDDDLDDTSDLHVEVFGLALELADVTDVDTVNATVSVEEAISPLAEPSDSGTFDAELDAVLAASLRLTVPPLELSDRVESASAEAPDDVAEAVRRAIAAIASAGVAEPDAAPRPESSAQLGEIDDADILDEPAVSEIAAPSPGSAAGLPAGLGSFAPPTMATRAEVVYARDADSTVRAAPTPDESSPSSGAQRWVG